MKFLGAKFRKQIKVLMEELGQCQVHFVRCIKPNLEKKRNYLDEGFVMTQIKYLGILETIQVRQQGFPCRMKYDEFYEKYNELDEINRHIRYEKHK